MRQWSVRLFGVLELERPSGHVTSFPGTKAGGILAYLALHLDNPVPREALAELFWPESDSVKQRTRVRQELRVLRAAFGADEALALPDDRHAIRLSSDLVTTDTDRFLQLLQEAKRSADVPDQASALSEAVALYRADLLTAYPEIGDAQRSLFSHRFEAALRELASLRYSQGDCEGAEECLQRLIAYNPFLEEAYVDLMKLYAASGQPAKIRRQYSALERMLQSEMGARPTEATRTLVAELLCGIEIPATLPTAPPAQHLPAPTDENGGSSVLSEEFPAAAKAQATSPVPWSAAWIRRRRFAFGVLGLFLLAGAFLALPRHASRKPKPHANPLPPLQTNQEKWKFFYTHQPDETGDSEPKAVVCAPDGALFVTGLVQTADQDTDILTLKVSPQGRLLARARYGSPERDCDRAFSLAYAGSGGIYVAGETFVPAGKGVREGWRLVLLHYDADLHLKWVRRSSLLTQNERHRVRVVYSPTGEIVLAGTAVEAGVPKILLLSYDSNGNLRWQRTFNAEAGKNTRLCDLTVDAEGALYVCAAALHDIDRYGSHTEWVTLGYDRGGTRLWTRYTSGIGHGDDTPDRIAFDEKEKAVYVAGSVYNGDPATGGSGTNPALVKYRRDGTPVWTRWDPSIGPEFNGDIALAVNSMPSVLTLVGTTNTPQRNSALALVQYDAAGNRHWARQVTPPPGFRSTAQPYPLSTGNDEVTIACLVSDQTTNRIVNTSQFLLLRYAIDGALKQQEAFGPLYGPNRPTVICRTALDSGVLIGGQSQTADHRLALTLLKY